MGPSLPEKLPRQKVHLYAFLLFFSTLLIYFYYPFETSSWTVRPVAALFGTIYIDEHNLSQTLENNAISGSSNKATSTPNESKHENERPDSGDSFENKISENNSPTTLIAKDLPTSEDSSEKSAKLEIRSKIQSKLSKGKTLTVHPRTQMPPGHSKTGEQILVSPSTENSSEVTTDISHIHKDDDAQFRTDSQEHSDPEYKNGFLVFSKNCRIPDLDPMHPSIRHLVSKSQPLDCSKDNKALTWSRGHHLYLDESAAQEKSLGQNYTCCYRSVQRENDGKSDDDVGFGKECISVTNKNKIQHEFIKVECQFENGTSFYKEFHSFIHDKPKVEKRSTISTNKTQYSVLIIGADAVSRMNMHRQLNRTANYLLTNMEAIEMYGFNKVGDNTFPNLIPMLTGYAEQELSSVCWKSHTLPLDRCNFIWKNFSAHGYRTFYAEDAPHISSFNYLKKGFLHQPTDYYFRPFIDAYQKELGREKHLNCYWCVGTRSETEAVLEWTSDFAKQFANRSYFAFSWINSLTHDFLNTGSAGDHMYEKFFTELHTSGALNRTIVVLMGDHGMRWGEIRNTFIGRLEERLPMLLISLPAKFKQEHSSLSNNLFQNAHSLVTPFDLYATLMHILNLNEKWSLMDGITNEFAENVTHRARSLFHPIPKDRTCDDAFIEEHWCTCESSLKVDIHSKPIKHVANFILNQINKLLAPVSHKCAVLSSETISDARLWQPPSLHKGHSSEDNIYTVIIHTKPGDALFEGTVKVSEPKKETTLLGSISRLNLYGNQSICIENAIFRKYCYCL